MTTTSHEDASALNELAAESEPRHRQMRELGVAAVFATRWRYTVPPAKAKRGGKSHKDGLDPEAETLPFTGTWFEEFAVAFDDELPRLPRLIAMAQDVGCAIQAHGLTVRKADLYLFALPSSDQVVASVVLECEPEVGNENYLECFDRMLDDITALKFELDGLPLKEFLDRLAADARVPGRPDLRLVDALATVADLEGPNRRAFPEQHEVVYVGQGEALTEWVEKLLYRTKAKHKREFSRQVRVVQLTDDAMPREANQPHRRRSGDDVVEDVFPPDDQGQPTEHVDEAEAPDPNYFKKTHNDAPKLGIVSTRASLIKGHDRMVEASVLLSAIQAVGTIARFRDIRAEAAALVTEFRKKKQAIATGVQIRDDLENLVDELGNLEFDLAFSVELPLMRIETYHKHLSYVLDVTEQSQRLSQMFVQIRGSVRSELDAITIREARAHDLRRRRTEVAIQILTALAVPAGLLLAFFGINATEVDKDKSITDWEFYDIPLLTAAALFFLPWVIMLFAHFVAKGWQRLHDWQRRRKPRM